MAVLSLQAGRLVSRQQMINAVWGERPPKHAVNLIQRHISGLRQALEPDRQARTPSGLLAWTDGGYLLTLTPGALDLDVFESELARARAAQAAGHLPEAAQALGFGAGALARTSLRWFVQPVPGCPGRPAGRIAHQRARGTYRARPDRRGSYRPHRGTPRSRRGLSAARTAARPAHARAVPSRPSGGCAGCVPRGTPPAAGRTWPRAGTPFSGSTSKSWPAIRTCSRQAPPRSPALSRGPIGAHRPLPAQLPHPHSRLYRP